MIAGPPVGATVVILVFNYCPVVASLIPPGLVYTYDASEALIF